MWIIANSTGFTKVPLNLQGSLLREAGADLNIFIKGLLWVRGQKKTKKKKRNACPIKISMTADKE